MRRWFVLFILTCLLISISPKVQAIEPRLIDNLTLRVKQSGYFDIIGIISEVNLTVFIPQHSVLEINVSPDNWEYVEDEFGNKKVGFHFTNPRDRIYYSIETLVENHGSHIYDESPIGTDGIYLQETDLVKITPEIEQMAYHYEKSLKGVAEMSAMVHKYVQYDDSLSSVVKSSDWVYENQKGVCAEYANLLAAMTRSKGIPTRYVSGWVYSEYNKTFIGHAWIEVLAGDEWVAFDPTGMQGGYVDGTHIKTSHSLDSQNTERLRYKGIGSVEWHRAADDFEIISTEPVNKLRMSLGSGSFASDSYGYIIANLYNGECRLEQIFLTTCVNDIGLPLLEVMDNRRTVWFCTRNEQDFIFKVNHADTDYMYTCPLNVYDMYGQRHTVDIEITGELEKKPELYIEGPEKVSMGEEFILKAISDNGFIFFSPNLSRSLGREWILSLDRPGIYSFYLYSDGWAVQKSVEAMMVKEFNVQLMIPVNVSLNETFIAFTRITNLLNRTMSGQFDLKRDMEPIYTENISFLPGATRDFRWVINIDEQGTHKISATITSKSIYTADKYVDVIEPPRTIIDEIITIFRDIFGIIGIFFRIWG